jgi:hypothetical protein
MRRVKQSGARLAPAGHKSEAHEIPLWPGLLTAALVGVVYLTVASGGTFHFRQSLFPHHVLIADAWLHGQLNVRDEVIRARNDQFYQAYHNNLERRYRAQGRQLPEADWLRLRAQVTPPSNHDWSVINGKFYGYWGPMVPALLLPYVAVAGLQASDMLFSCLVGMGTVLLTFLMLREADRAGFVPLTTAVCTALALVLGLGTVHFFLTIAGQVWFLSQVVATFFSTMAIWFILRTGASTVWPLAAGAAFGAAILARSSVGAIAPFFYCTLFLLARRAGRRVWPSLLRNAIAFSVPLVIAVGVILAYNYGRFGNVFETGTRVQFLTGGNPIFRRDYAQYGPFNVHYLSRNLYYYFLNPMLRRHPRTQAFTFDPFGNSMFLVTPPLLYVFRSVSRRDWFALGVWAGVVPCMLLLLLFQGSGWFGFGNRYLLDLMPLALLLIAIGMRGRLTRTGLVLVALSLIVNAWGTYRFTLEQF